MTQPVQADRLKAWIAEQDLQGPTRCRISFEDDRKVGPNLIKHGLASSILLSVFHHRVLAAPMKSAYALSRTIIALELNRFISALSISLYLLSYRPDFDVYLVRFVSGWTTHIAVVCSLA